MKTIEELIYYCREPEPVGALLLTGEWGCGKTYLIEHDLKESLRDRFEVLRISLFGMTSVDEMHIAVKSAWMEAYCRIKGINGIAEKVDAGKKAVAKMEFLPEWVRGIASTEVASFIPISTKLEGKIVILVFDDLERCRMNSVDVLGVVNDYCENQKYHTIIVANQERIKDVHKEVQLNAEVQVESAKDGRNGSEGKKANIIINVPPRMDQGELSYTEIKEKIIQRTVHYIPDYQLIINAVVEDTKCTDADYKTFLEDCKTGLLMLFAPDNNIESFGIELENRKRNGKRNTTSSVSRNIRSLKCAINDFARVYRLLKDNEFTDIEKWLYSFVSYVIAYKADIVKDDGYGSLFSDSHVREAYPAFQSQYMLTGVKHWILHGWWDETAISHEIEAIKKRNEAKTAQEIIKANRIADIDDEVLDEGFSEFLTLAYQGDLTLDEYVRFVENSCWAREYGCDFPDTIDWDKIKEGILVSIKKITDELPDGQLLLNTIGEENKKFFTEDEWSAYKLISDFALSEYLMYLKNRKLYIAKMQNPTKMSFYDIQNKRLNVFDVEMAQVTAAAFFQEDNMGKHHFVSDFKIIWKKNIASGEMEIGGALGGFCTLQMLLEQQVEKYKEEHKGKRTFSVVHTELFIKTVDELILACQEIQ